MLSDPQIQRLRREFIFPLEKQLSEQQEKQEAKKCRTETEFVRKRTSPPVFTCSLAEEACQQSRPNKRLKMVPHTAAAASAIFSSSVSSKSNKNRAASVVVSVAVGSKVFQGGDEIRCDDQQQITQELREGVARYESRENDFF